MVIKLMIPIWMIKSKLNPLQLGSIYFMVFFLAPWDGQNQPNCPTQKLSNKID